MSIQQLTLINSLTADQETSVSLLVYGDSKAAANNLKNVAHQYVIDRKEIITLKTNKLFSDGFALEQLFITMAAIKSQQWDEIINFSNDMVGAYLTSYLKSSSKKSSVYTLTLIDPSILLARGQCCLMTSFQALSIHQFTL